MNPASLEKKIPNTLDGLSELAEELAAFLENNGVDSEAAFAANLACEELVSNTIKYGYDDQDAHVIGFRVELCAGELRMVVTDDGHAFNPFTMPDPDTSIPLEERGLGGLGIHFVRKLLDDCSYERKDELNIVTVVKGLKPSTAEEAGPAA